MQLVINLILKCELNNNTENCTHKSKLFINLKIHDRDLLNIMHLKFLALSNMALK